MSSTNLTWPEDRVLIVGAGPVGLALSLDLALRGTRSIVIDEGSRSDAVLPAKAGLLNQRTLEFCRRWGIAEKVSNWGCPEDYPRDTVYCTSLVGGHLIGRSALPSAKDRVSPESPEILRKCPQFIFDPILTEAALATGLVEIRQGWRFVSCNQSDKDVTVELVEVRSGTKARMRTPFLVGCDGAGSSVRRALNIAFEGRTLDYSLSIITEIDHLENYHPYGRAERFMFMAVDGTWCNATSMDYRKYWRFTLLNSDAPIDREKIDVRAQVVRAMGTDKIPFKLLGAVPWRRSQCAAQTFAKGRVVLAGDAAHTTSPTGGHGLNTGLGDAAGLGWMIDAQMKGWGGSGLLEGYSLERRPVAIRNSAASTVNYSAWVGSIDYSQLMLEGPQGDAIRQGIGRQLQASLHGEWKSDGIALGYRYENSPLIVPDGSPAPPDEVSDYVPTARPGHRAPHAWLKDGRSTIDLFGKGFVMLQFDATKSALAIFSATADARGIPLEVVSIDEPEIAAIYEKRFALVRPDGHVAWRGDALPTDMEALWNTVAGASIKTKSSSAALASVAT